MAQPNVGLNALMPEYWLAYFRQLLDQRVLAGRMQHFRGGMGIVQQAVAQSPTVPGQPNYPAPLPVGISAFSNFNLMTNLRLSQQNNGIGYYGPHQLNPPVPNIAQLAPTVAAQQLASRKISGRPTLHTLAGYGPGMRMAHHPELQYIAEFVQDDGVADMILLTHAPRLMDGAMLYGTLTSSMPNAFHQFLYAQNPPAGDIWIPLFRILVDGDFTGITPAQHGILNTLIAMQDLKSVSWYMCCAMRSLLSVAPGFRAAFKITIVVRHAPEPDFPGFGPGGAALPNPAPAPGDFRYSHFSIPLGNATLDVNATTTQAGLAQRIFDLIREVLEKNAETYDNDVAQDGVIIRSIRMIPIPMALPGPALFNFPAYNPMPPSNLTQSELAAHLSQVQLRNVLRARFAHLSPELCPELKCLELLPPPINRIGMCMLESLCLMEVYNCPILSFDLLPEPTLRKRQRELKEERLHSFLQERIEACLSTPEYRYVYQTGNVWNCIAQYMATHAISELKLVLTDMFGSQKLYGYLVQYFPQMITDEHDGFVILATELSSWDPTAAVLAIYRAHAFVSTVGRLSVLINVNGGVDARIGSVIHPERYKPFALSEQKCQAPSKECLVRSGQTTPRGFMTKTGRLVLSFDCETGRCAYCIAGGSGEQYVQHACCVSLAFSTTSAITFHGVECQKRFTDIQQRDGCLSQMIEWIKREFIESPEYSGTEVYITSFNGSRFDMHLLASALLGNHHVFNVIMGSTSKLMRLEWANVSFIDFYNIYPGSLDKVYSTFVAGQAVRTMFAERMPPHGKYECFPYGILAAGWYGKRVPMAQLRENDALWGKKRCKSAHPTLGTLAEVNTDWWIANIARDDDSRAFFDTRSETERYCEEDTKILQLCAEAHYEFFATGQFNGKEYDCTKAFTVGSFSLSLFRQCFAGAGPDGKANQIPFAFGYNPDMKTGMILKVGSDAKELTLLEVIKFSERGALTYSNRRFAGAPSVVLDAWLESDDPTIVRMKEAGMDDAQILDFLRAPYAKYDINSSYPFIMSGELPIHPTEVLTYPEGVPWSNHLGGPCDLIMCSVDLSACGITGMTVSAANCTLAPVKIPVAFYDIGKKEGRVNAQWGQEVRQFVDWGAVVVVYGVVKFQTYPILREFITTFYAKRLEAQGIDPTTRTRIPGAVKDVFMTQFYKLLLNNIFGKLMQGRKPLTQFMRDWQSFYMTSCNPVVNVEVVNVDGMYDILAVDTVNMKPHVGDLSFVASFILSGGRLQLMKCMHGFQQFTDIYGLPCEAICGDTDSLIVPRPLVTRASAEFIASVIDEFRLGALKCEGLVSRVYSAAKKVYLTITDNPDGTVSYSSASKGVPKDSLKEDHLRRMVFESASVKVAMPMGFQASISRLTEYGQRTREVRCANQTRDWSQSNAENGYNSKPWESIDAFYASCFPQFEVVAVSLDFA